MLILFFMHFIKILLSAQAFDNVWIVGGHFKSVLADILRKNERRTRLNFGICCKSHKINKCNYMKILFTINYWNYHNDIKHLG